jgi:hypothetical protein
VRFISRKGSARRVRAAADRIADGRATASAAP